MSAHDLETLLSWRGRTVRDPSGDKIGKLEDLYLDQATDLPAYAGVRTGLFGIHSSLVPLRDAREDGGDVVVPYEAGLVRSAPNLGPDSALSPEEERALDAHYGIGTQRPVREDEPEGTRLRDEDPDTMVRSEEELRVGVEEMKPAERVRLKKVLVTEEVTQVVPVRREIIQLEHEPAPDGTIESVEELEGPPPER